MRGRSAVPVLCACLALVAAPASARDFQVYGTNNGALARDECPAGSYLVGVVGNAGAWLDQITVVCGKPKPDGTYGGAKSLPSRGGSGGAFKKALCPPNYAVGSAKIYRDDEYHILELFLNCKNVKTGHKLPVFINGGGGSPSAGRIEQDCGAGEMGTGLTIRHGQYVNGIGLICGAFSSPPPPATAACAAGLVWRERFDGDTVCVKPEDRYRLPGGSCRPPYVYRDVYPGDIFCVTPDQRTAAKAAQAAKGAKPVRETGRPKFIEVLQSVDLYSKPGGADEDKIGSLPKDTKEVALIGRQAPWYNVKWPKGQGWVYSGDGYVSLKLP